MLTPVESKSGNRRARGWWCFWAAVWICLLLPADRGLAFYDDGWARLLQALATLGFVGLLMLFARAAGRRWVTWLLLGLLFATAFFVRMLYFGLVDFSGSGFTDEFFIHLSAESVRVAWQQYSSLFVLLFAGLALIVAAFVLLPRWLARPQRVAAPVLLLVAVAALGIGIRATPEWQLLAATIRWFTPLSSEVPPERLSKWQHSPLVDLLLTPKSTLAARAGDPPRNLILLYIESGGLGLIQSSRYPDLMPRLRQLAEKHSWVEHLHASSYITIEGLMNSMCGTLLPFDEASREAMAGSDGLVDEMPCLGDVLAVAGYRQSYLGGVDKSYAGKGHFLALHGYDKVMGSSDWEELGLRPRKGSWGLSDADLFEQSFAELAELRASGRPFNLTLLTIGTHIPGFSYAECEPYGDGSERFLNAVHCTDQLVAGWVDRLRADGWLDERTLLLITGDHQVFPNPEMRRLFGEETVLDRRLPMIVIGKNLPSAAVAHGAGYDLAPTVLDLLGVVGNQQFALGRSLLETPLRPDYFAARYADVWDELSYKPSEPGTCDADGRVPGQDALSACEREELGALLLGQSRRYSAARARLDCSLSSPMVVEIPATDEQPLVLRIGDAEQSARFTMKSRAVAPSAPGLYALDFTEQGLLSKRQYMPLDRLETSAAAPSMEVSAASRLLVLRQPQAVGAAAAVPEWLRALGVGPDSSGIWIKVDEHTGERVVTRIGGGDTWQLDPATCGELVGTRPGEGHAGTSTASGQ